MLIQGLFDHLSTFITLMAILTAFCVFLRRVDRAAEQEYEAIQRELNALTAEKDPLAAAGRRRAVRSRA